ncbi:unnamed protein product, partial [Schistocephalus solidus]|uniref:PDCD2_C domain-containing protein n=1 Tax=Schistocephalus solidus TaxID=70667 RepID=A0A183SCL2_SCHSO
QHSEQHSCPNGSDDIKGLWRTTPTEFVPSVVQSSLANQTEERSQPAESNQVGSSVGSDEDTIGGAETLGKSAEVPSITKFKDADEEKKGAVFDADDFPTLPTETFSMFDGANYGGLTPVVLPPLHSALITQSVAAKLSAVEKERAIIEVFKPLNQVTCINCTRSMSVYFL